MTSQLLLFVNYNSTAKTYGTHYGIGARILATHKRSIIKDAHQDIMRMLIEIREILIG